MSEPTESEVTPESALPTITVVMPNFNHEKYLNDAIDSVLWQSYPNKRVVVVDDGSSDNSVKRVYDRLYRPMGPEKQGEPYVFYGKAQPNMDTEVMVCKFAKNHGPSFARNWGMKVSWQGTDAFMFLDSDDRYEAGKIEKSVAKWMTAPDNIGVVYTDYDCLWSNGARVRQHREPFSRFRLLTDCVLNCDSLVSRAAIEKCGGFDEQMRVAEDFDLWIRISEEFTIIHIPEPLLSLNITDRNSTTSFPKEQWELSWGRIAAKSHQRMKQRAAQIK